VKAIMTGAVTGVGDLGAVAEELVIDDARTAVTDSGRFRGDIFEDLPTRISQRPSRITPLPERPRLIERVRHNNLFVWNGLCMAMLAAVVPYGLLASSN
jgi:hypothetical protein